MRIAKWEGLKVNGKKEAQCLNCCNNKSHNKCIVYDVKDPEIIHDERKCLQRNRVD